MAVHPCESLQPAAVGPINCVVTRKIVAKAGGTAAMAVQEAIDEAADQADKDGRKAVKNETCAEPCQCVTFVLPQVWNVQTQWVVPNKKLTVTVTGMWTAYVLCFDPAKHPKEGGKPKEGDGGGHRDEGGGKSGDKDKKPKAPKKHRKK